VSSNDASTRTKGVLLMLTIADWLQNTRLGLAVREGFYWYVVPQVLHMLGMVLFGGAVVMSDLRLLGWLRRPSAAALAVELMPLEWLGFWLTSVTGVMLFMSDATRFYDNPAFIVKVVLLLLIALNAWIFCSLVYRDVAVWDRVDPPTGAKLAAALSLILWIGVIAASRAIAFAMQSE
jgi:hypothetical protein